jgi:hypothetical protein
MLNFGAIWNIAHHSQNHLISTIGAERGAGPKIHVIGKSAVIKRQQAVEADDSIATHHNAFHLCAVLLMKGGILIKGD